MTTSTGIGTLNEGSLHAALKEHYAEPGDRFEVPLDRFVIDVMRDDLLIEIQTGSISAMGRKFDALLESHRILVVHPVAVDSYMVKDKPKPRKSPTHGSIWNIFEELVRIPTLLDHPNLEIELVLIDEEQIMAPGLRARGRRWGVVDRRLLAIRETHRFRSLADVVALLPELPPVWTTADLATEASVPRNTAQQIAYCLKHCGITTELERTKAGIHYRFT